MSGRSEFSSGMSQSGAYYDEEMAMMIEPPPKKSRCCLYICLTLIVIALAACFCVWYFQDKLFADESQSENNDTSNKDDDDKTDGDTVTHAESCTTKLTSNPLVIAGASLAVLLPVWYYLGFWPFTAQKGFFSLGGSEPEDEEEPPKTIVESITEALGGGDTEESDAEPEDNGPGIVERITEVFSGGDTEESDAAEENAAICRNPGPALAQAESGEIIWGSAAPGCPKPRGTWEQDLKILPHNWATVKQKSSTLDFLPDFFNAGDCVLLTRQPEYRKKIGNACLDDVQEQPYRSTRKGGISAKRFVIGQEAPRL